MIKSADFLLKFISDVYMASMFTKKTDRSDDEHVDNVVSHFWNKLFSVVLATLYAA
jgi:hypothetical protein